MARPQAGWLPGKVTDQYWFTIRQSVDERDLTDQNTPLHRVHDLMIEEPAKDGRTGGVSSW